MFNSTRTQSLISWFQNRNRESDSAAGIPGTGQTRVTALRNLSDIMYSNKKGTLILHLNQSKQLNSKLKISTHGGKEGIHEVKCGCGEKYVVVTERTFAFQRA